MNISKLENEFSMSDFFPEYPNIDDENFREIIFSKYEFRELICLNEKKIYRHSYPHQEIIRRFMMSFTGYESLLLYHEVGTGKTKIAINVGILYMKTHRKCIILMKGEATRIPFNAEINRVFGKKIHYFMTDNYAAFGNRIEKMTDEQIHEEYDNTVIIIDEVHHLRTLDEGKGREKTTYNNIYRFLHNINGCKKLIMTGTPMVDSGGEIASIMNLILPEDNKMNSTDVQYHLDNDEENDKYFKSYFNGRVSFVRKVLENIGNIIYEGENVRIEGKIRDAKVKTKLTLHEMSDYQREYYYDKDPTPEEEVETRETTFALSARHALNFAPPTIQDKKGNVYSKIEDYLEIDGNSFRFKNIGSFSLEEELKDIKKIKKYSTKYGDIVGEVKNSNECTFIYLPYIPSGIYPMAICFRSQGYSYYDGGIKFDMNLGKKRRFAIITSDISLDALRNILDIFNSEQNKYGEYLQVVFGSKRSSEAIGFVNVRRVDVIQPDWNSASIIQAQGRATRPNSLATFPRNEKYIKIYNHAAIVRENGNVSFTKDIELYLRSDEKQTDIERVQNYMQIYAFDAYLNMKRNNLEFEFDEYEIDYSSYLEYFGNDILIEIKNKIIKIFDIRFELNIEELDLDYDDKLIIRTIDMILNDNTIISNRFGIECYIKKSNDILYLQPTSSIGLTKTSYLNSFYSNFFITQPKDITSFAVKIVTEEKEFENIFESENLAYDILMLDDNKRSILLEDAITKDIPRKEEIKKILNNNWFVFNDGNIVHIARKEPRILMLGENKWENIQDKKKNKYFMIIKNMLIERENDFPHEYYGLFTSDSSNFRLKSKENIKKVGNVCVNVKPQEIVEHIMNMNFNYEYPNITKKEYKNYLKVKQDEWGEDEEDAEKYYYWMFYNGKKTVLCDELLQILIENNMLFIK